MAMQRLLLFIPLVLFGVMGYFLYNSLDDDPRHLPSALIDKPFPEFALPELKEPQRQLSVADLKGKPALVNVWATWCPSCRVEHPHLINIAKEITIVGINYKDERVAANKWLQRFGDPYLFNIFDVEGVLGIDLGVYGAPETFLIDAEGVIRYKHVGVVDQTVWETILKPIVDEMG